jgi:23S rRNA pseudouridine2605 synthase
LNKILAAAGLGSRRAVEELILQGRVDVDGQTCSELHRKFDVSKSKINVDGQSLRTHRPVYLALNKPAGVVCTNRDPEGRMRAVDLVPSDARVFPVGRLDRSSVGLLLLTNDGELAQRLAHPRNAIPKTYFAVVQGQIEAEQLERLRRGVYLAEGMARVEGAKIRRVRQGCTELEITLTEGKNREIRRVLARLGHKVVVLRRLTIGPLRLGDLPEGMHRPLTAAEVAGLYASSENKAARTPSTKRTARTKKIPRADAANPSGAVGKKRPVGERTVRTGRKKTSTQGLKKTGDSRGGKGTRLHGLQASLVRKRVARKGGNRNPGRPSAPKSRVPKRRP